MGYPLSAYVRAPVEQLYRGVFKNFLLNDGPPPRRPIPPGRLGCERVLPPHLGEMGTEIRYHLARAEPWLRNGWKIVTRRPAFYPEGTVYDAPEYLAKVKEIQDRYALVQGYGGFCILPVEAGIMSFESALNGVKADLRVGLSDVTKSMMQAHAEVELRALFLEWFHYEGRSISDYDRTVLSFSTATIGNWQYGSAAALRPSFLPPTFENPREPVPPHIGVQIRAIEGDGQYTRNSDADWMLQQAARLSRHFDLPLLVYGHPSGCYLPERYKTTFDAARPQGQMARELGYLKSCRVMLAPDSGWTDLMGWLEVPTLLEKEALPGQFESLRAGFRPKIHLVERDRPITIQADSLLAAEGLVLPPVAPDHLIDTSLFPWEP